MHSLEVMEQQKGVGTAAIPAEEQWARTVEVFIE